MQARRIHNAIIKYNGAVEAHVCTDSQSRTLMHHFNVDMCCMISEINLQRETHCRYLGTIYRYIQRTDRELLRMVQQQSPGDRYQQSQ